MEIRKHFEPRIFYIILGFSYLVIISCAEIRKDKHLSAWDVNDDLWNKYQTTQDPFDWNWNRWDWKDRFTLPPLPDTRRELDYLIKKNDDNTGIYLAIFLIIFVLLSGVLASLKYYCEERTSDSRVAAHVSRPTTTTGRSSDVPVLSRNTITERPHIILEFSNPATDSSNIVNIVDPPPRYDEVVIGDLSGEGTFPEVQPAIPDTPPPQYDGNNPPRY